MGLADLYTDGAVSADETDPLAELRRRMAGQVPPRNYALMNSAVPASDTRPVSAEPAPPSTSYRVVNPDATGNPADVVNLPPAGAMMRPSTSYAPETYQPFEAARLTPTPPASAPSAGESNAPNSPAAVYGQGDTPRPPAPSVGRRILRALGGAGLGLLSGGIGGAIENAVAAAQRGETGDGSMGKLGDAWRRRDQQQAMADLQERYKVARSEAERQKIGLEIERLQQGLTLDRDKATRDADKSDLEDAWNVVKAYWDAGKPLPEDLAKYIGAPGLAGALRSKDWRPGQPFKDTSGGMWQYDRDGRAVPVLDPTGKQLVGPMPAQSRPAMPSAADAVSDAELERDVAVATGGDPNRLVQNPLYGQNADSINQVAAELYAQDPNEGGSAEDFWNLPQAKRDLYLNEAMKKAYGVPYMQPFRDTWAYQQAMRNAKAKRNAGVRDARSAARGQGTFAGVNPRLDGADREPDSDEDDQ